MAKKESTISRTFVITKVTFADAKGAIQEVEIPEDLSIKGAKDSVPDGCRFVGVDSREELREMPISKFFANSTKREPKAETAAQ
jgi:hypothetical protein